MSQDRPTAPELLEALAEYLYVELRPNVPSEQRFKTLVAANVCAVVAREIRAGNEPTLDDARLFLELIGRDPADVREPDPDEDRALAEELAGVIRSGRLDDRLDAVVDAMKDHVRRKLEINRPGYWEG